MEIILDKIKLQNDSYNWEKTLMILKENFQRAGFERELLEENRLVFTGSNQPKDFAYMGIMYSKLVRQKWFEKSVLYWHLIKDDKDAGDFIFEAKDKGIWT